ncbi:MAG: IS1595 family transposase [Candidatus Poribacteria bacterium]|nr:IS1595 family transposase [Candidatus Poribacteria bacterium]
MARRYSTEEAARDLFESIRWPNGPVCPHCGNTDSDRIYKIVPNPDKKIRAGVHKCAECREEFTVTVGTVMESSKIPLTKWLFGFYMMCASKTQVSALQLQRQLDIGSYRTAWFMCHRIRYALEGGDDPLGGTGGTVEADETFIGGKRRGVGSGYVENKTPVISTVERGGKVMSKAVGRVTGKEITKVLREQVAKNAHLNTDESLVYEKVGKEFASHATVNHHAEEYARRDEFGTLVTTNTVEGFFGNSKRSIDGTHHHISRQHTNLYFAELDYKYNTRKETDGERTVGAIQQVEGKRVMYKELVGE